MPLTPELIDHFTVAGESSAILFVTTYKKVLELGLDEDLAELAAEIVLTEAVSGRGDDVRDMDLGALLARLSPGGSA